MSGNDALVDIIEKALYGYVKPFQAVHVARKVVRVIAGSENREAVLAELRAAWGDDLGGALVRCRTKEPVGPAVGPWDWHDQYRWAEPPRQPAPSIQEPEHG